MGWYDAIKDGISIAQKADNIDLISKLLEAQKEIQDMQQENFELKSRIKDLEEIEKKEIKYNGNRTAIYEVKNDGKEEGPYCCTCWEDKRKLITVHEQKEGLITYQVCPVCGCKIEISRKEHDWSGFNPNII